MKAKVATAAITATTTMPVTIAAGITGTTTIGTMVSIIVAAVAAGTTSCCRYDLQVDRAVDGFFDNPH